MTENSYTAYIRIVRRIFKKRGNIEEYREVLEAINRNSKRLQILTNDSLDFTRIESQSLQLRKEKIDLNELVL